MYKRQIYQIAESNRKNRFGSENRIESNRNFFCPNWNALPLSTELLSRGDNSEKNEVESFALHQLDCIEWKDAPVHCPIIHHWPRSYKIRFGAFQVAETLLVAKEQGTSFVQPRPSDSTCWLTDWLRLQHALYSRAKANDPSEYRIIVGEHNIRKKEGLFVITGL